MTEPSFEDRQAAAGLPEALDDDYPERALLPEPEEPVLPGEDGYVGAGSVGTTVEEQRAGESLDRRLAREVPEAAGGLLPGGPDEERAREAAGSRDPGPESQAVRVEPERG